MKRSRLSKMSPKRRSSLEARRLCVETVHERAKGRCEAPGALGHTCSGLLDVHEPLSRARGGDPTDPDACLLLCRAVHDLAHANPDAAHAAGLLLHSWSA